MTRDEFIRNTESCQKAFRRFLTALCCGDSDEADDIAQESLVKAYLSCDGLKEPAKFKAWLYRIGFNTFFSHRRAVRPVTTLDDAPETEAPERSTAPSAIRLSMPPSTAFPSASGRRYSYIIWKATACARFRLSWRCRKRLSGSIFRAGAAICADFYLKTAKTAIKWTIP